MNRLWSQSTGIHLLFLLSISTCFSSEGNHTPCTMHHKTWTCVHLNYIPVLPSNTTSLKMIYYHVDSFSRASLSNITGLPLKVLEFKRPAWGNVHADVFTDMIHLSTLRITHLNEYLNLSYLFASLPFTNITTLQLSNIKMKASPIRIFENLRNTSLHHLRISNCYLKVFNGTGISYLPKLRTLDLSQNNRLRISSWGHLPALKILNLSGTYIDNFPPFQQESLPGKKAYPELERMFFSLSGDHSLNRYTFAGLPKLKSLSIQTREVLLMSPKTIGSFLPNLKYLFITGTPSVKLTLEDRAIVSPSLTSLKFEKLTLKFFNNPLYGYNLTNLTLISFRAEKPSELSRILPSLNRLKSLNVVQSRLTNIPASVCNLTNLTHLNLRGNFIYSWTNKNCQVMGKLRQLSLAKNDIKKLNKFSFSDALWNNLRLKWDLSNNNYYCNCGLLWFRNWLKKNKDRIIGYPKYYRCKLLGLKIKIKNYAVTYEYCNGKSSQSKLLIFAVCLGSISLLIIICTIITYTKRWSVRYWCHLLWARHRRYTALPDNVEYIYDAFVCYSSSDINWVLNELLPEVEESEGFQLCLHDRDFKPGQFIVDNILESIQTSRRVILVLSPEFARSSWCNYEASLAEQRLLEENRNMLVPILLEDIPDHIQKNRLAILLKSRTYLEWTNDKNGQELFWKKLTSILEKPPRHVEI